MFLERDLKTIKKIVLHCSDSDYPEHDSIDVIEAWHKQKGWKMVGYHYYINRKGHIAEGRPLTMTGAHCSGNNMDSIGICFGGKTQFYESQFRMGLFLLNKLMRQFGLTRKDIYPHNYFVPMKTCPNFDIRKIWTFEDETYS